MLGSLQCLTLGQPMPWEQQTLRRNQPQRLAAVEVGNVKPSVVMKTPDEHWAWMFIASQRQKVQGKQKSVMQIKVAEISPEKESRRSRK